MEEMASLTFVQWQSNILHCSYLYFTRVSSNEASMTPNAHEITHIRSLGAGRNLYLFIHAIPYSFSSLRLRRLKSVAKNGQRVFSPENKWMLTVLESENFEIQATIIPGANLKKLLNFQVLIWHTCSMLNICLHQKLLPIKMLRIACTFITVRKKTEHTCKM